MGRKMAPNQVSSPNAGLWPTDYYEQQRMLTRAMESSLNAIGVADIDAHLVYVNDSLVQMWGYDGPEDFQGRLVADFFDGDTIHGTLRDLADNGVAQGTETGIRKDGTIVHVRFNAAVLPDQEGRPAYLFGSFVDVSEQVHLQELLHHRDEQLRALLNAIPGMVYQGRPDWTVEIVNDQAAQLTGYPVEDFRSGAVNWLDLIHPDDRDQVLEESRGPMDGSVRLDQQYRICTQSGQITWVRDVKTVRIVNGQSLGAVGFVTDITTSKRMEEQLAQADRLATVGLMAAGVAHEMNNPLSVMLGYVELIDEKINHLTPELRAQLDEIQKPLRMIEKTGRRCKRIVEDLLSFGEPGQQAWETMDLVAVLRNSLGSVELQSHDRGITVSSDFTDNPRVSCNSHQLKLVFNNLLLNAVQSMPDGGMLRITSHTEPGDPAWGLAVVSDTGVGITRATLRRIFDPFFTTKPVGEGTGLGLSIVYGIVEQHGGRIDVDSTPGQGTVVHVRLPLA